MNSCLQVIVNKFEALGTAGEGFAWVDFYLFIISHSSATGLGPAADGWTCVCKLFSMNLKPLGTAGMCSVSDVFFLEFIFFIL
jgi:hypothetical protein